MIEPDQIDRPEVVAEIDALLSRYEAALMANDIAVLDALFWASPKVRRFGATENLYGAGEIAAYRKARSGGAPPRQVTRRSITALGPDLASADIEYRPQGGSRTGRQTQLWARFPEGWRIVSAHVSLMLEPG